MTDAIKSKTVDDNRRGSIPRHIAIIMDGNGRWAKKRGLPRIAGHRKGVETVREIVTTCASEGVEHLTLFAFSSENWRRPDREVKLLIDLFMTALEREVGKLHKNNIRFRVIGDISGFGDKIAKKIRVAEELTCNNTALTLSIAANYGGRWDIANACQEIAKRCVAGEIDPADINSDTVAKYLSLNDITEPDLFIRTGGDQRVSNFLLWQIAYTELYFTEILWPDFTKSELKQAMESFAQRQRRFGLTGDQVEAAQHA